MASVQHPDARCAAPSPTSGGPTVALVVAGGTGTRLGGAVPKQYQRLGDRPLLAHAVDALHRHPGIDAVLVAVAPSEEARARPLVGDATLVHGGTTRRASVAAGLAAAQAMGAARLLVHDAARPLLPAAVVDRLLDALDTGEAAIPVLPVADTLTRTDGTPVDRTDLHRVQTPQAFRLSTLAAAHAAWTGDEPTDDAQMVRALGVGVAMVQGSTMLDKVTHPEDMATAEARLAWDTRSASGFDVHRLEDGEELWLGGVRIPHDKGLSGHSDADVALHALTDALLGTIAAGDIGTHFPPSDPQWKGASSDRFLRHAADLIAARGGRIGFVDLTIICEAPKVGPHREAIRARIAELLALPADRVSVKATTTERLGFTGRGEGIAAQAVATVRLPGEPA